MRRFVCLPRLFNTNSFLRFFICFLVASLLGTFVPASVAFAQAPASKKSTGNSVTFTVVKEMSQDAPKITVLLDNLPVRFPVEPYMETDTPMVPLRALAEALGMTVQWDGTTSTAICVKDNLTVHLHIGNSFVRIQNKTFPLPEPVTLVQTHTVVPLDFFSRIMGYQVFWDEENCKAVIISPKRPLEIWGFYALGSLRYSSWQDLFANKYPYVAPDPPASHMAGIFLGWFAVNENGKVVSNGHASGFSKPDGWPAVLLQARIRNLPTFAMYFADNTYSKISKLLENPVYRHNLVHQISTTAREYDGVLIDFEGLGQDENRQELDKQNMNLFIDALKTSLNGQTLAIALPACNSYFLGYDHKYLGEKADLVVLMAYGYEDTKHPTPTAPWDKVEEAIKTEIELVDRGKLLLGIPAYGTLYKTDSEGTMLQARPPAKDSAKFFSPDLTATNLTANSKHEVPTGPASSWGNLASSPTYNPQYSCNYNEWEDQSSTYYAFTEDEKTLQARVLLAQRHGLRGVAIWRLGLLPERWWDSVNAVVKAYRPNDLSRFTEPAN